MAPMAGVRGVAILALAVVVWIAEGPGMALALSQNGLPRPAGYAVNATTSYGPTPPCLLNNVAVTCDWYGFAYTLYPVDAEVCLNVTRTILANTTQFPPGSLAPYEYYYLSYFVFNPVNNESYCLYGCFDMSATGPVASPPGAGLAPPPALLSPPALAPSPVAKAPPPPPALLSPPAGAPASAPVAKTPPPPSVLVSPPPPVLVSPPPPSVLTSPPPPSVLVSPPPPATVLTSPPPPSTSAKSPPPPPKTVSAPPPPQLFNLGDAGILRVPTGLVWFVISGALLILSGLVAF